MSRRKDYKGRGKQRGKKASTKRREEHEMEQEMSREKEGGKTHRKMETCNMASSEGKVMRRKKGSEGTKKDRQDK